MEWSCMAVWSTFVGFFGLPSRFIISKIIGSFKSISRFLKRRAGLALRARDPPTRLLNVELFIVATVLCAIVSVSPWVVFVAYQPTTVVYLPELTLFFNFSAEAGTTMAF